MASLHQTHWVGGASAEAAGFASGAHAGDGLATWPVVTMPQQEFRFGRCRLVPRARVLLRESCPVALGSRAFDVLHLLLACRGAIVPKERIVRHVWPNTIVEESNLRFQIAALRKALGSDRHLIKTIPGRGYLLAEEVDPD
ncbi:MAG TPA: winged helix-turn-helix domain-containing protein [Allosphingosinicella sp.]|jgi:DNA-binding winged helix-turn-helix (wHTH) protein